MNRRGFLSGILAAAVAPAIVRADSLMRIVPRGLTVEAYSVQQLKKFIVTRDVLFNGEEVSFSAPELLLTPMDFRAGWIGKATTELARRIDGTAMEGFRLRAGDVITIGGVYE